MGHKMVDGNGLTYRDAVQLLTYLTGKTHSPVYHMIVKLVVLSNAVSFFGKDLGELWHNPVI